MTRPPDLQHTFPMELSDGTLSTTTDVWQILLASRNGDFETVRRMGEACPALLYAQYNYTPPIHFAVREGHTDLVRYLLDQGAHDPGYRIYPFLDSLQTLADDRGLTEILALLDKYAADPSRQRFRGDNGRILFPRTAGQKAFEQAVDQEDLAKTEECLREHPEWALDTTFFWGEGILTFAAKENNRAMVDLLMRYGAQVPDVLKWTQFYYLEHDEGAPYMLEKGMNPNTRSWQEVTILHDMAQKGKIDRAELLLRYGAAIDPVDDEYRSTPLGMAARWGHAEMVRFLLESGADPEKAGASWATPLAWARKKGHAEVEQILLDNH